MMFGTRHVLASCLLLAGCVDGFVEDGEDLGTEATELREQTWDPQSEQLLGAANRSWDSAFAHDSVTGSLVLDDGRGFRAQPPTSDTPPESWLLLTGGSSLDRSTAYALEFRVAHAPDAVDAANRHRYHVQVRRPGGTWTEYCRSRDGSVQHAYALSGAFDRSGNFYPPPGGALAISFACPVGAVAKAIRWNFAPGATHPTTGARVPDGKPLVAATAMARADFCGTGTPNTIDDTPIQFDDAAGYSSEYVSVSGPLPDPGEYRLEAAWITESAAISGAVAPYFGNGAKALCISKWRYQALRPSQCSVHVPDPRTTEFARFCDDFGGRTLGLDDPALRDQLIARGAVTFSYSKVSDIGIWEWKLRDSDRWITTEQGLYNGYGGEFATPDQLPPQYAGLSHVLPAVFRGAILKRPRGDTTRPLYQYRSTFGTPSTYRTTTLANLDGWCGTFCLRLWGEKREVGHVFISRPAGGVALYEYAKNGQFRLVRAGETWPSAEGWTPTRRDDRGYPIPEGYALR